MQQHSELIKLCIRNDRRAIKVLYEQCYKFLVPICYRYHKHEEDVCSAFNLAFMKILKSLEQVQDKKINFTAWSKRLMINTLIDEYRKNKLQQTHYIQKETDRELEIHSDYIQNDGISAIGSENILKLMNEIPEISAKVFNLYVIDGYTHKEIGELLSMSEGTSKWHLSTAKKLLREKITLLETSSKLQVV